LLAYAIVEVVTDAALFAVADFENLALEAFAFGDVAGDSFDFDDFAAAFDEAGADFDFDALAGGRCEIPFGRGRAGIFENIFEPLPRSRPLVFGDQINDVARENFRARMLEQSFAHLIYGSNAAIKVVGVNDIVGVLEQFAKAFFESSFILELLANEFRLRPDLPPEQRDPRQSGKNDDHHSAREHEEMGQRPPGGSLKEIYILGAAEH
jgi:hypothetical protein